MKKTISLLSGLISVTVGYWVFAANAVHNQVHILTDGVFLISATRYPDYLERINSGYANYCNTVTKNLIQES